MALIGESIKGIREMKYLRLLIFLDQFKKKIADLISVIQNPFYAYRCNLKLISFGDIGRVVLGKLTNK